MNGVGSPRAASTMRWLPITARVRGTSIPAARNAVSWSTLLTSSSIVRRPLTVRRPCASSQLMSARV